MKKFTKRGFTLIELLVVIAVIGILSSIVLVSLSGARDRAKDARVMSSMDQFRTQAILIYDSYGGYNKTVATVVHDVKCAVAATPAVPGGYCSGCDAEIDTLCEDIAVNDSTTSNLTTFRGTDGHTYCSYVQLKGSQQYRCIDSNNTSKELTAVPTTICVAGCEATPSTCLCP